MILQITDITGRTDSILKARCNILTTIITNCNLLLDKFSSGDGSTCHGTRRQDECQAYMLGHLYTQLRKLNYLGDATSVIPTLRDRSIGDVSMAIEGIHKRMCPNKNPPKNLNIHHDNCGFTEYLNAMVDSIVCGDIARTVLLDSSRNHLTAQLKKITPSGIHLAKYQTRNKP